MSDLTETYGLLQFGVIGLTFGLAGGLSPGPITALVVSQTLRFGRIEGYKVATVPIITDGPLLFAGLYFLHATSEFEVVTAAISLSGSVVLVWLAIDTFRAYALPIDDAGGDAGSFRKAIAANLANPHPYVFWLTIGAPTAAKALSDSGSALVAFVAGFGVAIVGAKVVIAFGIDQFREHFEGAFYRWTMKTLGVALGLLAIHFAWMGINGLRGAV